MDNEDTVNEETVTVIIRNAVWCYKAMIGAAEWSHHN